MESTQVKLFLNMTLNFIKLSLISRGLSSETSLIFLITHLSQIDIRTLGVQYTERGKNSYIN